MNVEHNGRIWYLYEANVKLNDGNLYPRYFFSLKELKNKKTRWESIDIPAGFEVSKSGMIPVLKRIKKQEPAFEV